MQEYVKEFSIDDVKMYREQDEDMDFSIVEIWALAEGNNSHRNPFSVEVLEKDANTFKGKFIVAKYNKFKKDAEGHEIDEAIVGYVDPREKIEFKKKFVNKDKMEKEFVVVKALLSKIYAKDIVDMFRKNNSRKVSCEFSCKTKYEENQYGRPIDEYGREMNVDNPILSYHIHGITILGLSVNPSVPETEIKVKQFAEKLNNKKNLKDLAIERMQKINHYKDFQEGENSMEDNKQFSDSVEKDKETDVIMEKVEATEEPIKSEETIEAEEIVEASDEVELSKEEKEETLEEQSFEEEIVETEKECYDEKVETFEKEKVEDKEEEKEIEEKQFSLDAYVDVQATLALLQDETAESKELAEKVVKMSAEQILTTVLTFAKENKELKKFKEDRIKIDKEFKLSSIMASVKEDISEKDFMELQKEGATLQFSELDGFENKVKAFAYEASKKDRHSEDGIMRFSGNIITNDAELSADDIYKKYL